MRERSASRVGTWVLGAVALLQATACGGPRVAAPRPVVRPVEFKPQASQVTPAPLDADAERAPCPAGTVQVPGGTYLPAPGAPTRTIPGLCVDVTEVTVDAYADCVAHKGCLPSQSEPRGATFVEASCNASETTRGTHPINCIDAMSAMTYCRALGMRLPEDVEWWWIARSGLAGRAYAWGDEPPTQQACWSGSRMLAGTCGAGGHPEDVTAQGVLDLAGNVAEWTRISAPADSGPVTATRPSYRVHGGSFASRDAAELAADATCLSGASPRAAAAGTEASVVVRIGPRERCTSDALRSPVVGFRCVRTLLP